MSPRQLARVCAVLGGVSWLARWLLGALGGPTSAVDAAYWAGVALLVIGVLGGGAELVRSSAAWLRVVVAVASLALGWSVLVVAHDAGAGRAAEGIAGLVAVLLWAPALRRPSAETRTPRGAHSR